MLLAVVSIEFDVDNELIAEVVAMVAVLLIFRERYPFLKRTS